MRTKEVEEAIKTVKEFRKTGYCTLLIKCDNDRIRANTRIETSIDTVLSYIEQLETQIPTPSNELPVEYQTSIYVDKRDAVMKDKIRDKIKELEKEMIECEHTMYLTTTEVLKEILGE